MQLKSMVAWHFSRNIIEVCKTPEELNSREIYWIDYYDAVHSDNFYNLMAGGNAGDKIAGYSDEWRREHFKRCAEKRIGKRRVYKSGAHPMKGMHHTEEAKRKISVANKGKTRGAKSYAAKPVICVTTGEIFDCISDARRFYGVGCISQCCTGKRYHAGNLPDGTPLIWAYFDKENCSYVSPKDLQTRWSKNEVEQYTKSGEHLCTYKSARIASEHTKVPYGGIIAACTGKIKTSGGYIWKYVAKDGEAIAAQN